MRIAQVSIVRAALGGQAKADDACIAELNKLASDWSSIAVLGTAADEPNESYKPKREHVAREVWYMRSQIRLALRLCNEGKTHDAMLRMNAVRAWFKLPEVDHPADHRRSYEEKRP